MVGFVRCGCKSVGTSGGIQYAVGKKQGYQQTSIRIVGLWENAHVPSESVHKVG